MAKDIYLLKKTGAGRESRGSQTPPTVFLKAADGDRFMPVCRSVENLISYSATKIP
jgi:hypothetical protein